MAENEVELKIVGTYRVMDTQQIGMICTNNPEAIKILEDPKMRSKFNETMPPQEPNCEVQSSVIVPLKNLENLLKVAKKMKNRKHLEILICQKNFPVKFSLPVYIKDKKVNETDIWAYVGQRIED